MNGLSYSTDSLLTADVMLVDSEALVMLASSS